MSISDDFMNDDAFNSAVRDALKTVSEKIIHPHFGKLSQAMVETKSAPDDYVTLVDIRAEKYLTEVLSKLLPSAKIVGEEAVSTSNDILNIWPEGWVWTIDPLDGTRNFVNNNNNFCSMISLLHEGVVEGAWIYRPLEKDCFQARKGGGITYFPAQGDARVLHREKTNIGFLQASGTANAMGLDEPLRAIAREKLKTHQGRKHIGSAGLDAIAVALGHSQFVMHSKLTPWDSCPALLFCQEAGFYTQLAPHHGDFTPLSKGVLLMAETQEMWQECCDFVFKQ